MDVEAIIAAVDEWGRVRQHSGYRSHQAHTHPADMPAGATKLAAEDKDTAARSAWAEPMAAAVDNDELTNDQLRKWVWLVDLWAFDRWLLGWTGTITPPTGPDADRHAWITELHHLAAKT